MKAHFQSYKALTKALIAAGYSDPKEVYLTTKGIVSAETGLEKQELFVELGRILRPVVSGLVEFSEEHVYDELSRRGEEAPAGEPGGDEEKAPAQEAKKESCEKSTVTSAPPVAPFLPLSRPKRLGALSSSVFKALSSRKCTLGEAVDWVMQHLDDPEPDMIQVPSLAAWSLRAWAGTNAITRSEFYRTFACKRLPTQRMIEIQERMRDDGRDIDARILEVIAKREALDSDDVLSESSEDSDGEYDLPEEYY